MQWWLASAGASMIALASCGLTVDREVRDYDAEVDALAAELAKSFDAQQGSAKSGATLLGTLPDIILTDPEVRAALRALNAASAGVGSAESALKPQVSGSLLAGGYQDGASNASTETGASVDARVSQLLYDGGEAQGSISLAELGAREAEVAATIVANRVVAQASAVWLATWSAQASLASLKALEAAVSPHAQQVERMANMGLIDRSVSDMIEGRMLEYDQSVVEAQYQLDTAAFSFKRYFGTAPWALTYPNPPSKPSDFEVDISNVTTPAVKQAALRVLAARAQKQVVEAKFSPRIALEAGANSPMDRDENPTARIGLNMTFNFYDGGKREADLAQAKQSVASAEYTLASARQASQQTLTELLERSENLRETIRLTADKIAVIDRQLKVAETQIQTGRADVAKVFEVKLQRHQLEGVLRQARVDLRVAEYGVAAELGVFSIPSEVGPK